MMKRLISVLKRHKEGLVIGGLVGFVAAYYLVSQGRDLSSLVSAGKGLFDSLIGRSGNPLQSATNKLYLVFITLGMMVGFLADVLLAKALFRTRRSRAKPKRRRW